MTKKSGGKKKARPKSDPEAPENLEANALAYFRDGERFRKKGQQRSMAECYEKALEMGRASDRPSGLAVASEASLYLGHRAKTRDAWGIALEMYKESVELGRKSGTPEGLYAAARAAWNLGNTYEEAGMDGLVAAFRDAVELGRTSEIPDALEVASKAAFNLAQNVELEEGIKALRESIELGKSCGTKDGVQVANRARFYLSSFLLGQDKVNEAVELLSEMIGEGQWNALMDIFSELVEYGDTAVRSKIPVCIGRIGDIPDKHRKASMEILRKLSSDSDETVQRSAKETLTKFED